MEWLTNLVLLVIMLELGLIYFAVRAVITILEKKQARGSNFFYKRQASNGPAVFLSTLLSVIVNFGAILK